MHIKQLRCPLFLGVSSNDSSTDWKEPHSCSEGFDFSGHRARYVAEEGCFIREQVVSHVHHHQHGWGKVWLALARGLQFLNYLPEFLGSRAAMGGDPWSVRRAL